MDNGLIFPYQCYTVHDKLVILTTQTAMSSLRVVYGGAAGT